MSEEKITVPWVVVTPNGVRYVGFHSSEEDAWQIALGWPTDEEISDAKKRGWYAAPGTLTWKKPEVHA